MTEVHYHVQHEGVSNSLWYKQNQQHDSMHDVAHTDKRQDKMQIRLGPVFGKYEVILCSDN